MKRYLLYPFLALAFSQVASADIMVRTLNESAPVFSYKLPSGRTEQWVSPDSPVVGGGHLSLSREIKEVEVEIKDRTGNPFWSGTIPNDRTVLLFRDGDSKPQLRLVGKGSVSMEGPGYKLINGTGRALKVDLFKTDDSSGKTDLDLPADLRSETEVQLPGPVYLHAKDASGKALNKVDKSLRSGYYYLIFQTKSGEIDATSLGYLE